MELASDFAADRYNSGQKPVTLQNVAERAGVSPSTVSRILNGTARVSEEKRERVRQVIETLGFRPNPVARSLAGGRTKSIGVLTQFIDSPFYGAGVRGIEEVLTSRGFTPIVMSGLWDKAREKANLLGLIERKVDGLIVLTSRLDDQELLEITSTVPGVVTGRYLQAERLKSINFNNRMAGQIAVKHLLNLGHRNIAVIAGMSDHKDSDQRLEGIMSEATFAGVSIDRELIVIGDYHEPGGHRAMRSIIEKNLPFSAVVSLNDQMALGAMLALKQAGLRVPEDVSVVGMDDLPSSSFFSPPLTSVAQPVHQMGCIAAELLLNILGETSGVLVSNEVFPNLVVRESTKRAF